MNTPAHILKENAITENLQGMDMSILEQLDLHVTMNGGLTTENLIKTIDFHKFTIDSFTYLLRQINTHKCTFLGIGPFMFSDGGWYNIRERTIDIIKKLTGENLKLKTANEKLTNRLKNVNTTYN